jgi:PIN domain nuclease of toxin-antitoxin system
MNLLLDTHMVIWMATEPDRIPPRLLTAIEQSQQRFVSNVTALEVQLKNLKNSKLFPFSLQDLEATMKAFSCSELPITYRDIAALASLPVAHKDPFDHLLMAQAANGKLCLASLDRDIYRSFLKNKGFDIFTHQLHKA